MRGKGPWQGISFCAYINNSYPQPLSYPQLRRSCFTYYDLYLPMRSSYTFRSMLQEVPPEFTASTGWPGCDDCGIVTSSKSIMEYPVKFDLSGVVVKSVGDGWANFLRHQKIRKGKFIVLEPADERCLAAMVYPPANTPEFTKTLRASHNSPHHSAKLVLFPFIHSVLV